jgi:integrase
MSQLMDHDLIVIQQEQSISSITLTNSFEQIVEATLATVAPSSARVYRQTFLLWHEWCKNHLVNPLDLIAINVRAFLMDQQVSQKTRQRQLSALRKLARILALDYTNPAWRSAYESLLLLKAPTENATNNEREVRALSPSQAARVLEVWSGDKLSDKRNLALIALLFLTGLRRSEAAVLRWADLDLDEGTLLVRHGKGDKARTAAIAGDMAIQALRVWKSALGDERRYVFCTIGKGSRLGPDEAMSDHAVYDVVKHTEQISGIRFSPHDARRTFITEALATGAPLADIREQAGHKQESTTLRYAKPVDARHRRAQLRLRYGG